MSLINQIILYERFMIEKQKIIVLYENYSNDVVFSNQNSATANGNQRAFNICKDHQFLNK